LKAAASQPLQEPIKPDGGIDMNNEPSISEAVPGTAGQISPAILENPKGPPAAAPWRKRWLKPTNILLALMVLAGLAGLALVLPWPNISDPVSFLHAIFNVFSSVDEPALTI
jgi:hypothetical protein